MAPTLQTPAAGGVTVLVHVADGSRGGPTGEELDVELILMIAAERPAALHGRTDANGMARITVPAELVAQAPLRGVAKAEYRGLAFFSEPFVITGRTPTVEVPVVVYEPTPRVSLPHWSYVALAAIFVLAVGLVAFRRPDRQLPD